MIRSYDMRTLASWELVNPFNIQHNQMGAGRSLIRDPDLIDIVKDSFSNLLLKMRGRRKLMDKLAAGNGTSEREKEREHVIKSAVS